MPSERVTSGFHYQKTATPPIRFYASTTLVLPPTHAASRKKQFPGSLATISKSKIAKTGFTAANGTKVERKGMEMAIAITSEEGDQGGITFQDADVDIPIISTGKLADADMDS